MSAKSGQIHDALGLLLNADAHSAGIQDRDGAVLLFDRLTAQFLFPEIIIGDGGHAKGLFVLPKLRIVE